MKKQRDRELAATKKREGRDDGKETEKKENLDCDNDRNGKNEKSLELCDHRAADEKVGKSQEVQTGKLRKTYQ